MSLHKYPMGHTCLIHNNFQPVPKGGNSTGAFCRQKLPTDNSSPGAKVGQCRLWVPLGKCVHLGVLHLGFTNWDVIVFGCGDLFILKKQFRVWEEKGGSFSVGMGTFFLFTTALNSA